MKNDASHARAEAQLTEIPQKGPDVRLPSSISYLLSSILHLPAPIFNLSSWVAGAFTVLVAGGLVIQFAAAKKDAPLLSPKLIEARDQLRLNPADEQLKQEIRTLDLISRQGYFRHLFRMRSGAYLLLGGTVVLIFTLAQRARFSQNLPMPEPQNDLSQKTAHTATRARFSVATGGVLIGILLFCLSAALPAPRAQGLAGINRSQAAEKSTGSAPDAASPEELRRNWPRFRGPDGGGVVMGTNFPTSWDATNGTGIAWKILVPASGFNSPIIYSNRVFFSGGDRKIREVFCLDATTGKLLWRHSVTAQRTGEAFGVRQSSGALDRAAAPEVPDSTGYAACTMATDGRRAYVIFATGDVAAFTFDGKLLWQKTFGPIKNPYGYATSLATWQDRVILQLDQGESDQRISRLYALDGTTGRIVWEQPRGVGSSWATPIVIDAAGKAQIITLAVPWVIAYAATDGAELWRVDGLNGEITPSPIFAGGLVVVASPSEKLLAIRPDGHGDVTKTHIAWSTEENVPDVTSPISNGELVFTVTTGGLLTCFDLKDGKKLWQHDFDTECHSSPAIAGNNLYMFSQHGTATVVAAARQFKEIFRTEMPDSFHASPAFADGGIFMKGMTNLWCLRPTGLTGPTGQTNASASHGP